MKLGFLWTLGVALVLSVSSPLRADQADVAAAANAFANGQEAELRGDHARAATAYELADRISPSPEALRSATRARVAASQMSAAARHAVELERRYPEDPASVSLAQEVLARAAESMGRLTVECPPECHVLVDGLASTSDARRFHTVFLQPGKHTITARFGDGSSTAKTVTTSVGQRTTLLLSPEATPAAAPAATTDSAERAPASATSPAETTPQDSAESGWHPAVGLVLGGTALALGGVAVWSALDTAKARDEFRDNPSRDRFEAGDKKDLRTNILIGAGAVVGAVSIGILTFGTRWSGSGRQDTATLGVRTRAGGTELTFAGSF